MLKQRNPELSVGLYLRLNAEGKIRVNVLLRPVELSLALGRVR